jgi:glutamine synthetase
MPMTKGQFRTGVQKAIKIDDVPHEKWTEMLRRTITGAVFVGLGVYLILPHPEGIRLYTGVGCILFGATTWSTQVVTGTLKALLDPLRAYKRAVKGIAPRHGCEATFMAKPWADRAGSGFHVHLSFADASSGNLCADDRLEGSDLLRHAIGGMKALMSDCMAILAPNANSYRRFRANSYAPVAPTWGVNNRTVSLRVPAGPPITRHVEHRVAGADAHPHLVLAALLAAAHHGLTHRIDPGPPVEGDGYAAAARDGVRLPTDWVAAVDRLEASEVLRDYLGSRFVDMFVSVKRTEQDRFGAAVTALDYDWYLGNA